MLLWTRELSRIVYEEVSHKKELTHVGNGISVANLSARGRTGGGTTEIEGSFSKGV